MRSLWLPVLSLLIVSCQSANYGSPEQLGYPKMGQVADRVDNFVDAQQEAVAQLQSARAQLAALAAANDGDLQARYDAADGSYNATVEQAVAVGAAIASLEESASAVFQEWQEEIAVYTDAQLKADNQAKLGSTWQSYQGMLQGLRQSQTKMNAVLAAYNDNMNGLRQDLNATALASRKPALLALASDIEALVHKMNIAIANAEEFAESV